MVTSRATFAHVLLLLLTSWILPARAENWQYYQHDPAHTGNTNAFVNAPSLTKAWSAPRGYTMPLIVGDTVYGMRGQGGFGGTTAITSFRLATGAINWSYSARTIFPSLPAVAGGLVVFHAGFDAELYVLDATTGALRYKVTGMSNHTIAIPLLIPNPADGTVMAYCADDSSLRAVRLGATSGSILWTQTGYFGGNPTLAGNSIILASDGNFYAFDRTTGAANHFHDGGLQGLGYETVAYDAARRQLYILEERTGLYEGHTLTAYHYTNNQQIEFAWTKTGPGLYNTASVAIGPGGKIYSADPSTLIEIDPDTGATLRSVSGTFTYGVTPLLTKGLVWVHSGSETMAYDLGTFSLVRTFPGGNSDSPNNNSAGAFVDGHFILDYGWIVDFPGFDVYWNPTIAIKPDFNGDNHADLVWQNSRTGERSIWLLRNGTLLGNVNLQTVALPWQVAGAGDFNDDGYADLVWQNPDTGQRSIWLMRSGIHQSSLALPTMPPSWQIAGAGDFNNDGHADLVWQNSGNGQRAIWFMRNGVRQSGVNLQTMPPSWQIAGAGDFNGDGHADLVWQNSGNGQRAIWFLRNGVRQSSVNLQATALPWQIAGAGDFNDDGYADLVWQNLNTGQRAVWLLRNGHFQSSLSLPTVALPWQIANH